MTKIIFFDIDGTLRPFETGRIPASTKQAIRKAHEAGLLTAIATGRHWMEIYNENLLEDVFFDAFITLDGEYCFIPDPDRPKTGISKSSNDAKPVNYNFSLSSTAAYFDPAYATILKKIPLCNQDIQTVINYVNEHHFSCLFEEERCMYANFVTPELMQVLYELGSHTPPVRSLTRAFTHPVYMLIPVMDRSHSEELEARLVDSQIVRWSDGLSFDITRKGISKVSGIKTVLHHFDLTPNEAAAIGDGLNDVEMLQFSGLGIAVGNAHPSCLDAANIITAAASDDGILQAIDLILTNYC